MNIYEDELGVLFCHI